MRFFVDGFSWNVRWPRSDKAPSRAQALRIVDRLPASSPNLREAAAALKVGDYDRAVEVARRSS